MEYYDKNNIEVTENFEIEIEEIESEKESEEKEFLHQISTSTKPNAKLFVDVSEHIESNYIFITTLILLTRISLTFQNMVKV